MLHRMDPFFQLVISLVINSNHFKQLNERQISETGLEMKGTFSTSPFEAFSTK